jgi:regulator of sigma D
VGAAAAGSGGSISIGDIARILGAICDRAESSLKSKTSELNGQAPGDLSMEDQRKLQELGEIMKAFSTLFANLIKAVSEAGDKSASKI